MSWTKLAVSGAVITAVMIVWMTHEIWAAAFLGVLFALSFNGPATWLCEHVAIPAWLATLLVLVLVLAVLTALVWVIGPPLVSQVEVLAERIPEAAHKVLLYMEQNAWGQRVLHFAEQWSGISQQQMLLTTGGGTPSASAQPTVGGGDTGSSQLPEFGQVLSGIVDTLSFTMHAGALLGVSIVVMLFVAFDPQVYQRGFIWLVPRQHEAVACETMERVGTAMRWWMIGRLTSMFAIGAFTSVGMWMIDMPAPMALGALTGLFSFVPNIGPISAAIPGLLLALGIGPWMVVWVLGVYLVAQLIESNLVSPLVDQFAVSVPPGVLIVAQFVIASLTGVWGMIVATPLLVIAIVLVQQLYVRKVLLKPIEVTGSTQTSDEAEDEGEDFDETVSQPV